VRDVNLFRFTSNLSDVAMLRPERSRISKRFRPSKRSSGIPDILFQGRFNRFFLMPAAIISRLSVYFDHLFGYGRRVEVVGEVLASNL
jgi:hypothetical protein